MMRSEAAEIVGLLQYIRDWNCSPTLDKELNVAIAFYQKKAAGV